MFSEEMIVIPISKIPICCVTMSVAHFSQTGLNLGGSWSSWIRWSEISSKKRTQFKMNSITAVKKVLSLRRFQSIIVQRGVRKLSEVAFISPSTNIFHWRWRSINVDTASCGTSLESLYIRLLYRKIRRYCDGHLYSFEHLSFSIQTWPISFSFSFANS